MCFLRKKGKFFDHCLPVACLFRRTIIAPGPVVSFPRKRMRKWGVKSQDFFTTTYVSKPQLPIAVCPLYYWPLRISPAMYSFQVCAPNLRCGGSFQCQEDRKPQVFTSGFICGNPETHQPYIFQDLSRLPTKMLFWLANWSLWDAQARRAYARLPT